MAAQLTIEFRFPKYRLHDVITIPNISSSFNLRSFKIDPSGWLPAARHHDSQDSLVHVSHTTEMSYAAAHHAAGQIFGLWGFGFLSLKSRY